MDTTALLLSFKLAALTVVILVPLGIVVGISGVATSLGYLCATQARGTHT